MNQTASAERFLGVICLHCKRPVPLLIQPAEQAVREADKHLASVGDPPNRVVLAWCPVCNREAPYSTSEIVSFAGPVPLSHFHPRQQRAMHKAGGAY